MVLIFYCEPISSSSMCMFFFPILEKFCLKEHLVGFIGSFTFKRISYEIYLLQI